MENRIEKEKGKKGRRADSNLARSSLSLITALRIFHLIENKKDKQKRGGWKGGKGTWQN